MFYFDCLYYNALGYHKHFNFATYQWQQNTYLLPVV